DVHIEFLESDLFANIPGRFDLIISNPPYIPSSARVEADFEPALALFSGTDGMDAMRGIAADLFAWLNPEGRAFFEIEPENSKSLIFLLENQASVADVRARVYGLTDMEGKDRFIAVERY
ncbi:MAG TPA: peptide chain release factor N(5)-glutamine methyltransferase, partial [Firmicutes bacterium]|nr:peptide chain release factor N(5)-glutamine methyltransferase [Bacillota bacterium]